jgi:FixJ family two-component response regulator
MAMVVDRKVLVIEDDDSLRPALERLLDAASFQVAAYALAEARLAGGSAEEAGCLVSDLKLVLSNGLSSCKALN